MSRTAAPFWASAAASPATNSRACRIDQSQARELYNEILSLVIPAIETGWIEGGEIFKQPRRELRPRPLYTFEGRKFCGSYSESSLEVAARLGFGRIVLMLPQRGAVPEPDDFAAAWQQVHGPGTEPPRPCVSGQVFVDESADRALEVGSRHVAHTMRAAIVNYEMDSDVVSKIPGYESYAKTRHPARDDRGHGGGVRQDRDLGHAANGDRADGGAEAGLRPAGLHAALLLWRHAAGRGGAEHADVRRDGDARDQELDGDQLARRRLPQGGRMTALVIDPAWFAPDAVSAETRAFNEAMRANAGPAARRNRRRGDARRRADAEAAFLGPGRDPRSSPAPAAPSCRSG